MDQEIVLGWYNEELNRYRIFYKSSSVAEMGDSVHNRHHTWAKRGGCYAPFAGEVGPRLTQCGLGRGLGLLPYQVASLSIQPFGHNRHESKTGGCAPFRGELRPHLTQRRLGRGLPQYQCVILIHPAV